MERLNSTDSQPGNLFPLPALEKSMEMSQHHNKTQILEYEGDGIEGIPYY